MNKLFYLIPIVLMITLLKVAAQDDGPPPPPPIIKTTPAPVLTELPTPAPAPQVTSIPVQPRVQPLADSVSRPAVQPLNQPVQQPPQEVPVLAVTPQPQPIQQRLYEEGAFPGGPRLKPANIMSEGHRGSWLVGKFVVVDEQDEHHYTIQSHVDSIGFNLIDVANKIGGGRPVTVHLTIVEPPPGGLPHEFMYLGGTPLKVTEIERGSNEVWAIDLTKRK
jgi:hypothetical protein